MRVLGFMNSLMKNHIGFLLLSILAGTLTVMAGVGLLSASSVLISKAALHPDISTLMALIVVVRFFSISRGVMRYVERIVSHNTTFKILSSLRRWFYKSFNDEYSESNKSFNSAEMYTRLVNDIDTLKDYFLRVFYPLVIAGLTGIITSIFLLIFNHTLALLYICFYVAAGFIIPYLLFTVNKKVMDKEQNIKKQINIFVLDLLNGIIEVSSFELKNTFREKFIKLNVELTRVQHQKNTISIAGENLNSFATSLLIVIVLIVTAPLVQSGKLAGIYYAMLPLAVMSSFEALLPIPNILHKYNEAKIAGKGIFAIIKGESKEKFTYTEEIRGSEISIQNLQVQDEITGENIIKNLTLQLKYGKKIGIVGISGSGKTTLLKTLLGFKNFQGGSINIGDKSIRDLESDKVRELFTYVEQNPYLFNTTILENLRISNPTADGSKIQAAIDLAGLSDLIDILPDGLDTVTGQLGAKISGGEKQRIAIARALLKDSPIVLLDEPTAGLDVELEEKILNNIFKSIGNKSCIWVTHRLIKMESMDEIIVMDKGSVIEAGTHNELLLKEGMYYKLWALQQQYLYDENMSQ